MITKTLIRWYNKNKRDLPWRKTRNPYHIWLSEVILQQTRVEQGTPYYYDILQSCPNIDALATIKKEKFFKLWQGLGYYRRAENLLSTANEIVVKYNGKFPNNYHDLIQLKGIGPYTAAAVSSIAFGEPQAVVDGNVYRVLSRLFAIDTPTDGAHGKKLFSTIATELIDPKDPATSNQAYMEFGALICTPVAPDCPNCPVIKHCLSAAAGTQLMYPVRKPKKKAIEVYQHFILPVYHQRIPIRKRTGDAIWRNLFEPPTFSLNYKASDDEVLKLISDKWILGKKPLISKAWETTHLLTHQKIYATFWIVNNGRLNSNHTDFIQVSLKQLNEYPVHRLFDKFLKKDYLA